MTQFGRRLEAADRFVDAATIVCEEAKRLGSRETWIGLLFENGPFALSVDTGELTDDQRLLALGEDNWRSDPAFAALRQRVAPVRTDRLVLPLVGPTGWFGVVSCKTDEPTPQQLERELTMLVTQLSVWCTNRGVDVVPRGPPSAVLGPRQERAARLAARGHSNSEIAEALGVSINTVKARLKEVFERFGVHSRSELGRVMLRHAPLEEVPDGVTCIAGVTVTRAP